MPFLDDVRILICEKCETKLWHWPEVKAPLWCQCGHLVWSPTNPWGPGNRPTEDDMRLFGTPEEREDAAELGKLKESEVAAPPSSRLVDNWDEETEAARAKFIEELNRRAAETDAKEAELREKELKAKNDLPDVQGS